ncbi:helix-turn-helix domain-containing protein [Nonomuraea sp. NPDC050783]|uniref:helix-turn-helix domain-containing protein n=1 Tax=Nonomuraea sp. NPDC050783 TaxID=3154634 RepID=UPI0034661003
MPTSTVEYREPIGAGPTLTDFVVTVDQVELEAPGEGAHGAASTAPARRPRLRHLTARRLQEAARLLAGTALPHHAIARRVGHRSEVGFHPAFKREYGVTPGDYRRAGQGGRGRVS